MNYTILRRILIATALLSLAAYRIAEYKNEQAIDKNKTQDCQDKNGKPFKEQEYHHEWQHLKYLGKNGKEINKQEYEYLLKHEQKPTTTECTKNIETGQVICAGG
ncbi:hypothetical protein [Phormidesmis priestleyi]|uniref:hypothetical protein n=1 Tax=Phormidesmis priestleyi TaxID=268141 RepID=UPI00083B6E2E|nr:hypothetical protein [Phormidesmis priestleyi]